MLPKSKRLTKSDFTGLRARISYRGANFDIATVPGNTTKYACIIAKKRIRRAVDRNKARRKVYEAIKDIELLSPTIVLVYPTKQALSSSVQSLREELRTIFATL